MIYVDLVMLLNFLIDFFLLLGTNRLCGYPPGWGRAALAAGLGGVYGGACMVPGVSFLGNTLWRLVILCIMSWLAFGFHISALRRGVVFVFLSFALGGLAMTLGRGDALSAVAGAAVLMLLCVVGFRGRIGEATYIPVQIRYGGKQLRLMALRDTGNTLRDPVTGKPVLVISADAAQSLTGLTLQQLKSPVEALANAALPGLRLIPYRAVGQPCGMLLALKMEEVKIGKRKESALVAFAPEGLSKEGAYQALAGGMSV